MSPKVIFKRKVLGYVNFIDFSYHSATCMYINTSCCISKYQEKIFKISKSTLKYVECGH